MRKLFLLFMLVTSYAVTFSQKLSLNLFAGTANYEGDMQDKFFNFTKPKLAIGGGFSYQVADKIYIRTGITFATITADDKNNARVAFRNLNFTSPITEVHLVGEYHLFNLEETPFTPYIFAGIAVYHFNPYTFDTAGTKYFLQPLSTEGEGFYQNRKPYNLTQFAIPFGGGIKLALNDNINVGLELGLRKLFTDYLDDVSTTYVDPNLLLINRGPKALELAFRAGEVDKTAPYPVVQTKRGESKNKDWYYFTGLTLSYRFAGNNTVYNRLAGAKNKRSKVGCPARVY